MFRKGPENIGNSNKDGSELGPRESFIVTVNDADVHEGVGRVDGVCY